MHAGSHGFNPHCLQPHALTLTLTLTLTRALSRARSHPAHRPSFPTISQLLKAIAKMQNIVFAYPGTTKDIEGNVVPNPIILNDVTTQCCLASRVACVGPNGAGKSTLVKCLVGDHEPQKGEVWKHPHLRMAYVSQHAFAHVENHLESSPVEYIQWRYSGGVDKEGEQKDTLQLSDEEEKRITVRDKELAKAGINQVGMRG